MIKNNLVVSKRINSIKTVVIMSLVFVSTIGLGFVVAKINNNINYLWFSIGFSLIINFSSYFFSASIALSSSGAVEIKPEEYQEYHDIVKNLISKAKMPMPKLYIINDISPNAFATGRNQNHAAIAVTTGLLSIMNKNELEGVLAHEISHIRNNDILIMSMVIVLVSVFTTLAHISFSASNNANNNDNNKSLNILGILISIVAVVALPIASMIIQASISRKREFMADASGAILTENPKGLASALQKIGSVNIPVVKATESTAHLYISNPFGSISHEGFFQKMFMTHPPIGERVNALLK